MTSICKDCMPLKVELNKIMPFIFKVSETSEVGQARSLLLSLQTAPFYCCTLKFVGSWRPSTGLEPRAVVRSYKVL